MSAHCDPECGHTRTPTTVQNTACCSIWNDPKTSNVKKQGTHSPVCRKWVVQGLCLGLWSWQLLPWVLCVTGSGHKALTALIGNLDRTRAVSTNLTSKLLLGRKKANEINSHCKSNKNQWGITVYTYSPSLWEAEAGGSLEPGVQNQGGQHKTPFQIKGMTKKIILFLCLNKIHDLGFNYNLIEPKIHIIR